MTSYNGANNHNFEDLLTTIRNGISENGMSRPQGPSSPLMARREAEDGGEFELPAIFKPGHQTSPEKPNLFGRLSDALKPGATAEHERSRTVIRFEPAAAGRMIEPPQPQSSTVALPRRPEPEPEQAAHIATDNTTIKREMPSFFDTRLNKLGELSRAASEPKPVEQPAPPPQQAMAVQPPPLLRPIHDTADAAGGGAEDVAAQLLRPILQQWLTDNMPRIVERALRSEISGEPQTPGPAGQPRHK